MLPVKCMSLHAVHAPTSWWPAAEKMLTATVEQTKSRCSFLLTEELEVGTQCLTQAPSVPTSAYVHASCRLDLSLSDWEQSKSTLMQAA